MSPPFTAMPPQWLNPSKDALMPHLRGPSWYRSRTLVSPWWLVLVNWFAWLCSSPQLRLARASRGAVLRRRHRERRRTTLRIQPQRQLVGPSRALLVGDRKHFQLAPRRTPRTMTQRTCRAAFRVPPKISVLQRAKQVTCGRGMARAGHCLRKQLTSRKVFRARLPSRVRP
jgi:hypothetical protein